MSNLLIDKLKEVLSAVLPIVTLVLLLHFTLVPLAIPILMKFLLGALAVIGGLTLFLIGIDLGITPIGRELGVIIAKSNKLSIVIIGGLILGFFVSIAEPDLSILATEISVVTNHLLDSTLIVMVVSIGIALLFTLGLLRMLFSIPLNWVLWTVYGVIFIIALFTSNEFLAVSFDASGATTGALAVPFVLAVSRGISVLKKDSQSAEEDAFGLVAVASSGAILAVLILSLVMGLTQLTGNSHVNLDTSTTILKPFLEGLSKTLTDSLIALLPILLIFLVVNHLFIKVTARKLRKIVLGVVYTLAGLTLFMLGVNVGFMQVGTLIGNALTQINPIYPLIFGFILGLVTILAEPAVHILTHQIEDVTAGYVNRKNVLITLALGVALAIFLSILRIIVPSIQLWHYLLPGYIISMLLSLFVPRLFVGIAFDAGGVASGPMTATFILAFAQGVASAIDGANVLLDGFGIIATVAMTPIIALQVLGLLFKLKSKQA